MTTDTERFAGSEIYGPRYYGTEEPHIANYVNYGAHSNPHWARPLAQFIAEHGDAPILDVGAAFGHLVKEINALGVPAFGIEWSKWATDRRVSPYVERQDARRLDFNDGIFGTVVSLDLLEHFEPDGTLTVMDEMCRVAKPQALMVHVIGAYDPDEDLSKHLSDPTHANREALNWYVAALADRGFVLDESLTTALRGHPVFAPTDWAGRLVAMRRAPDA